MDIIIRNIPENMIDKLDNIAKAEDLSRNALLTKLISDFVKSNDDFVINILPPIVRALVNQELYNVPLVKTQMKKIIVTAKTLYSHPKNVSKIYAALHTDLAW